LSNKATQEALKKSLTPKWNKYISFKPTAKQRAFLLLDHVRDLFYGGAAGGGKTSTLLIAALQYVDVPGYAALLLRDTFKNLSMPGSLMDLAEDWLAGTDAVWKGEIKKWEFSSGSSLSFGYLDGPRDHLNFKSAEFQFIGIDEASDLRWSQIIYMWSRLRKKKESNIPLRFRLTSNPGGISHQELKDRYIDKKTRKKGSVFIPAGLNDNPHLNKEQYIESLNQLDPITRAQLLDGDWDVRSSGRMFKREWFKFVDEVPQDAIRVRYWDMAATEPSKKNRDPDYTVGCKIAMTKEGLFYIESIIRHQKTPRETEQIIRQTAELDGKEVAVWLEQEPGSSGKAIIDHYHRNILPQYNFHGDKVTGSKQQRAAPFSSKCEAGYIYLVKAEWNAKFLDEMELFPDGNHDDQTDSVSGSFSKLAGTLSTPRIRVV